MKSWQKVKEILYSPVDDEDKANTEVLDSVWNLIEKMPDIPDDLYFFCGEVFVEWHKENAIVERFIISEVGKGERMISYPDKPPEFNEFQW